MPRYLVEFYYNDKRNVKVIWIHDHLAFCKCFGSIEIYNVVNPEKNI